MGKKIKNLRLLTTKQLDEILEKFTKKKEIEKKKTFTWLIIVASIVGLALIGLAVYKFFFAPIDEYDDEDYYDDDYDDIDYDEDYDDDDEDEDEEDEEDDDSDEE